MLCLANRVEHGCVTQLADSCHRSPLDTGLTVYTTVDTLAKIWSFGEHCRTSGVSHCMLHQHASEGQSAAGRWGVPASPWPRRVGDWRPAPHPSNRGRPQDPAAPVAWRRSPVAFPVRPSPGRALRQGVRFRRLGAPWGSLGAAAVGLRAPLIVDWVAVQGFQNESASRGCGYADTAASKNLHPEAYAR